MNEPIWLWALVALVILGLVLLDTLVLERSTAESRTRPALVITLTWVAVATAFGVGILAFSGGDNAEEYFSAYVLEKGLAIDNVFVFALLFSYFAIPPKYESLVLFDLWGLIVALASRVAFIAAGILFLDDYKWATYA
ncbi:MAG: TerC family protein, partial [Acidimicrobiales bacterium]